jgi:hypothetical protein
MSVFEIGPQSAVRGAASGWLVRLGAALGRDLPFYVVIAAALVTAELASWWFRRSYLDFLIPECLDVWGALFWVSAALILCLHVARGLARERPAEPISRVWPLMRGAVTPEVVAGFVLFAALALFTAAFTALKAMLPLVNPQWCDALLSDLDRALFFGRDPWRLLQPLLGSRVVTRVMEVLYGQVWMLLTAFTQMFFCVVARDKTLRRRYLTAYFMAWIINGVIVAGLMMSAGPAFYGDVTGDNGRFTDLVSYLYSAQTSPESTAAQQRFLWALHEHQGEYIGAGISAFPSLHVTMAMLCTFAGFSMRPLLGYALAAYSAMILLGSIHLGWHYAADDLFAIASAAIIWGFAGVIARSWSAAVDKRLCMPVPAEAPVSA